MTVISKNGLVSGPMLVAAPTMSDLLGLVYGLGTLFGIDDCNRVPQVRAQCWLDVKDPGNSRWRAGVETLVGTLKRHKRADSASPLPHEAPSGRRTGPVAIEWTERRPLERYSPEISQRYL